MKKYHVLLLLIVLFTTLMSIPAPNTIINYSQPDGYILQIRQIGDEWVHVSETIDGYTLLDQDGWKKYAILNSTGDLVISGTNANNPLHRDANERAFLEAVDTHLRYSERQVLELRETGTSSRLGSFPHSGNNNLLVIPAQFSNMNMTYGTATFNNLMNTPTNNAGCFKSYYEENSYGDLSITSTISSTVTVTGTHDSYGPQAQWRTFAASAIQAANSTVNFDAYDNDNDQIIEGVVIIHAGQGQESSGNTSDIWSHCSTLSVPLMVDGNTISYYAIVGESGTWGMQAGAGVVSHEFGHLLGIPDFYNTTSGSDPNCVGEWDLMSTGAWNNMSFDPAHHNPWSKWFLGWAGITQLDVPETYTMQNSNVSNLIYSVETPTNGEFFLLENRQQVGYNSAIPGHGLLIYHVDHNYIMSHLSSNDVNASTHKGLQIESCNGQLNTTGTPFPDGTNNSFADYTDPSSLSYAGLPIERPVVDIAENAGIISFSFWNGPGYNPCFTPSVLNGYVTDSLSVMLDWEFPRLLGYSYEELSYSNLFCTQYFGTITDDPIEVSIKYGNGSLNDYDGLYLHRVRFVAGDPDATYTLKIRSSLSDDDIITSQVVSEINPQGWTDVLLDDPFMIDPTEELWIGYECSTGINNPIGSDGSVSSPGYSDLVKIGDNWVSANTNAGWNGDWCIQIVLTDAGYDRSYIPEAYRIYKDGNLLTEIDDWETRSYEELNAPEGTFEYTLTAVYTEGESDPTEPEYIVVDYNLVPAVWADNIESYTDFNQNFYPWRSIDLDQTPNYQVNSNFPGNGSVNAFMVFNPSATMPPLGDNWGAHSGMKYLAAFAANPSQGTTNNDWLISPNYDVIENSAFSFYAKSVSDNYGNDRFRIMISTGSIDPEDFVQLSSGDYMEPPTTWTEYAFSLNDYIGQRVRVAINCISEATIALAVDDCTFDQRVLDNEENIQPVKSTYLHNNYPNPFNPETSINFDLAGTSNVELSVYNILGQKVTTLVNEVRGPGKHTAIWSGLDENDMAVSSGVYFYKLQAGTYTYTKKMILMK